MIFKNLKNLWGSWCEFWFAPQSLLNLAIFRIILCGTLFAMYLDRFRDVKIFYTDEGLLPRSLALQVIPEFYRPSFEWFFWSDSQSQLFHFFLVFGLLLLTLGIGGRILAVFVWILQIAFLHRNYSVAFGADLIGGIFLLYLAMTQSCERLSLIRLWFPRKKPVLSDIFTSVFYRMIQVQLCVIYIYTGMEKLKGGSWWDGTALWSVFANPQMVIADLTWFRFVPYLVVVFTFSTVLFEIYFPVLVWNSRLRLRLLAVGLLFHSGIGFIMALWSFSLVMVAPYILFVSEDFCLKMKQKISQLVQIKNRST
jgi:hypothetical protein